MGSSVRSSARLDLRGDGFQYPPLLFFLPTLDVEELVADLELRPDCDLHHRVRSDKRCLAACAREEFFAPLFRKRMARLLGDSYAGVAVFHDDGLQDDDAAVLGTLGEHLGEDGSDAGGEDQDSEDGTENDHEKLLRKFSMGLGGSAVGN